MPKTSHDDKRKDKKKGFKILFDSADFEIGDRKIQFSLYILNRVFLWAILEILLAILMVEYGNWSIADVVSLFTLVNWFLLAGGASALGIYTYGNTQEWRYRNGSGGGYPYNSYGGGGNYGPGGYDPYGGYGGGGVYSAGNKPINVTPPTVPGTPAEPGMPAVPSGVSTSPITGPPIAGGPKSKSPLPIMKKG